MGRLGSGVLAGRTAVSGRRYSVASATAAQKAGQPLVPPHSQVRTSLIVPLRNYWDSCSVKVFACAPHETDTAETSAGWVILNITASIPYSERKRPEFCDAELWACQEERHTSWPREDAGLNLLDYGRRSRARRSLLLGLLAGRQLDLGLKLVRRWSHSHGRQHVYCRSPQHHGLVGDCRAVIGNEADRLPILARGSIYFCGTYHARGIERVALWRSESLL